MPTYPFRCPACCRQVDRVCPSHERHTALYCVCGEPMARVFGHRIFSRFFHEGFNVGLGARIGSTHDLHETLKVKEEQAFLNSGVDTTYTLIDDPQGFGLDKDRLDWRRDTDQRNRREAAKKSLQDPRDFEGDPTYKPVPATTPGGWE